MGKYFSCSRLITLGKCGKVCVCMYVCIYVSMFYSLTIHVICIQVHRSVIQVFMYKCTVHIYVCVCMCVYIYFPSVCQLIACEQLVSVMRSYLRDKEIFTLGLEACAGTPFVHTFIHTYIEVVIYIRAYVHTCRSGILAQCLGWRSQEIAPGALASPSLHYFCLYKAYIHTYTQTQAGLCDLITAGLRCVAVLKKSTTFSSYYLFECNDNRITCKVEGIKKWPHLNYPYICKVRSSAALVHMYIHYTSINTMKRSSLNNCAFAI